MHPIEKATIRRIQGMNWGFGSQSDSDDDDHWDNEDEDD